MVRPEQSPLTRPPGTFRSDLLALVRAAVDGASASRAVAHALESPQLTPFFARPLHVIAAGKAASAMATAMVADRRLRPRTIVAIGTHASPAMPAAVDWIESAHPVPDERSVAAARRALDIATCVAPDECLVLLLSGGASALMAMPGAGLSLEEKRLAIQTMMLAGADIHALNTVRKHLSAVKGGRLAAACRGMTLTLAVSDVVGDDPSVIGSGPAVGDATTWGDAMAALEAFGGAAHPEAVRTLIARGQRGELPDTPKPGDAALARAHVRVIASRRHALAAARAAATERGYQVVVLDENVTGEAREAAPQWLAQVRGHLARDAGPVCVLSAGETTVRVTGTGRGGRNQEFALALVERLAAESRELMLASVGTDGIDGPTDAAGALVDRTSFARASAIGFTPQTFLDDNNAYDFFASLGDLVHLGRTDTNVGDVQILLAS